MKKLLPIILALIGTGAGVGAGLFLMPPPAEEHAEGAIECIPPVEDPEHAAPPEETVDEGPPVGREYVKLNNQFVVPVMRKDAVVALVVASLSVEVSSGTTETVYAREPKLRDEFLQVLFDHANIGGFEGTFTNGDRMDVLREGLLDAARSVLGSDVSDVLITEIARQDT
ncbi:flagellar basal body-associated protein FliL [Tropicibacter naphthalenivorans]|uniref:flagellar basal body-associated FliL family protein n=1 Tax=Tropicibacter naphthalenivorans TaxID=441103 RepID=UPI00071D9887